MNKNEKKKCQGTKETWLYACVPLNYKSMSKVLTEDYTMLGMVYWEGLLLYKHFEDSEIVRAATLWGWWMYYMKFRGVNAFYN